MFSFQADDSGSYNKHLHEQFERLKTQYNQMETEQKQLLNSLTSMGQISAENNDLRNDLSRLEANLKEVQSALDSAEAQV